MRLYIVEDDEYITIEMLEDFYKDWMEDLRAGKLKLLSIVTKEQMQSIEYRVEGSK